MLRHGQTTIIAQRLTQKWQKALTDAGIKSVHCSFGSSNPGVGVPPPLVTLTYTPRHSAKADIESKIKFSPRGVDAYTEMDSELQGTLFVDVSEAGIIFSGGRTTYYAGYYSEIELLVRMSSLLLAYSLKIVADEYKSKVTVDCWNCGPSEAQNKTIA